MASSVAGSINSERSVRSQRSNYKGRSSEVDESLFSGTVKPGTSRKAPAVSRSTLQKAQAKAGKDAVVLSRNEFAKIKDMSMPASNSREARMKMSETSRKDQLQSTAAIRKEKMMKAEAEARARRGPSIEEIEREHSNKSIQQKADGLLLLETGLQANAVDEAKRVASMASYAKCAAIREKQIKEKKEIQRRLKEDESRTHDMMLSKQKRETEIQRKKDEEHVLTLKAGAAAIRTQIKERDQAREVEREMREQEQAAMLRDVQLLKDEEERKAALRKTKQRSLMDEVMGENDRLIQIKSNRKQQEKEEDLRVARYLQERESRQQAYEEEQAMIKKRKANDVQQVMTMKKSTSDHEADRDALRARRAADQRERDFRAKEKAEAEKQVKRQADLMEANAAQKRDKELRLAAQARMERDEFDRVVAAQEKQIEAEKRTQAMTVDRNRSHKQILENQIHEREQQLRQERALAKQPTSFDRDQKIHAEKVERFRQDKIKELLQDGVPDKYTAELARKRL